MAGVKALEAILDAGVKVALVYGDRDHQCAWPGAEKISLAANWTGAEEFRSAGYEYVQTNGSYQGGMVRQYGNFAFIRVFESGHDGKSSTTPSPQQSLADMSISSTAGAYQPETVFRVFDRAISNKDIATGKISTLPHGDCNRNRIAGNGDCTYTSAGPSSSWSHKNGTYNDG